MSNAYCHFIVGCEVPDPQNVAPKNREAAKEMITECGEILTRRKVGFHRDYDQRTDFHWWGEAFASVDWGFQPAPDPVDESVKIRVQEAWELLPRAQQRLLGAPKVLALLGYD